MKVCGDCINYAKCVAIYYTYHNLRITPDSDLADRCKKFEGKKAAIVKSVVYCKDCKYYSADTALLGSVCARLFTVFPMQEYDFCSYGEHK